MCNTDTSTRVRSLRHRGVCVSVSARIASRKVYAINACDNIYATETKNEMKIARTPNQIIAFEFVGRHTLVGYIIPEQMPTVQATTLNLNLNVFVGCVCRRFGFLCVRFDKNLNKFEHVDLAVDLKAANYATPLRFPALCCLNSLFCKIIRMRISV